LGANSRSIANREFAPALSGIKCAEPGINREDRRPAATSRYAFRNKLKTAPTDCCTLPRKLAFCEMGGKGTRDGLRLALTLLYRRNLCISDANRRVPAERQAYDALQIEER